MPNEDDSILPKTLPTHNYSSDHQLRATCRQGRKHLEYGFAANRMWEYAQCPLASLVQDVDSVSSKTTNNERCRQTG